MTDRVGAPTKDALDNYARRHMRAVRICLRDHRLPARQIPCGTCLKAAGLIGRDD